MGNLVLYCCMAFAQTDFMCKQLYAFLTLYVCTSLHFVLQSTSLLHKLPLSRWFMFIKYH